MNARSFDANSFMDIRAFYQDFANLKFWHLEGLELANELERFIRNETKNEYFEDAIAERTRQAKQKNDTYTIFATDPDIVKYCKSLINFVRAVRDIDPKIKTAYIDHLVSDPQNYGYIKTALYQLGNYGDGALWSIVWNIFNNTPDQFIHLYNQFMAFRCYALEVSDFVLQYPVFGEKSKELLLSLKRAFEKSNVGHGVDLIQRSLEARKQKLQQILRENYVPAVEVNQLTTVFENFGLRTHLDALVNMAGVLNAKHLKYYDKYSNTYIYPPSVLENDRKMMDAYNHCSGARLELANAYDAMLEIRMATRKLPVGLTWDRLSEDLRAQYLKLNQAMIKLNTHLNAMQPLVQNIPAMNKLFERDANRIKNQITALANWNASHAATEIAVLETGLSIEEIFKFVESQINSQFTEAERAAYLDENRNLYHTDVVNLSDEKRNLLLAYNINSRLETGYANVQRLLNESFSFSHVSIAYNMLYEIGYMLKDYRAINSPDLIKQIKERLEYDLDILLEELTHLFHKAIDLGKQIELEQGFKSFLIMEQLQKIYAAYISLQNQNDKLPPEYRLNIDDDLLDGKLLQGIENLAEQKVIKKQQQYAKDAFEVRCYMLQYQDSVTKAPFNLLHLLTLKEKLKKIHGHNSMLYSEQLQIVIEKLVGIDILQEEIRVKEDTVKAIIGDDFENLGRYAHDKRIKDDIDMLRQLYNMRAVLLDNLAQIDKYKDSPEKLADIPLIRCEWQGKATRLWNHAWTYLKYSPAMRFELAQGLHENISIGKLAIEIPKFHNDILAEIDEVINVDLGEEVVLDDEIKIEEPAFNPKQHQEAAERIAADPTLLVKQVIDSRKGNVVLNLEWARHQFIEKVSPYLHESQRKNLKKNKKSKNGIYQINEADSIVVVNIKAVHNSMVRIERIIEVLNRFSEIPIEIKISNHDMVSRISAILYILKVRLKELFEKELVVLTAALTSLRDCMKNNTLNIFASDVWVYIDQSLSLINEGVDYYLTDQKDSENHSTKETMNKVMEIARYIAPKNTSTQRIENYNLASIQTYLTNILNKFFEKSGQMARTNNGRYDLDQFAEGSKYKHIAAWLNKRMAALQEVDDVVIPVNNVQPQLVAVEQHDQGLSADAGDIVQQAVNNAAMLTKHLIKAGEITEQMKQNGVDENEGRLIIFLRLFVEQDDILYRYRDGSYILDDLQDGTLQKSIAAFLNISNHLNSFMDSTVSLADGHHFIGFIKSIRDLVRIKYEIDQANLAAVFGDAFLQLNFDLNIVKTKINELIVKSLNYVHPRVIDIVAQARLAEMTLGLNDNALLGPIETALDSFIGLGQTFAEGKFDNLKKDFPYNARTLEIANEEYTRLRELNRQEKNKHYYLKHAMNSINNFANNLRQQLETEKANKPEQAVRPAEVVEMPLLGDNIPDTPDLLEKVNKLKSACCDYKHHLAMEINELREKASPDLIFEHIDLNEPYHEIRNADKILKLTIDKYNAIHEMEKTLYTDSLAIHKLNAFRRAFTTDRKNLIEKRRDNAGITFLKVLASIFSFGIAPACGLWRTQGRVTTKKIEKIALPTRAMS